MARAQAPLQRPASATAPRSGGPRAGATGPSPAGVPRYLSAVQRACSVCDATPGNSARTPSTAAREGPAVHATAAAGVAQAERPLPGATRIQSAFGRHDVSGVRTQVGGPAARASQALGARAYTSGSRIGFRSEPDLRLAAHEAAHVVQQQRGVHLKAGVGREGDEYEQQADAVADRVVAGRSAEDLLDHSGSPPQTTLQRACDGGGSGCTRCHDNDDSAAVQLDLEVNATRQFESLLAGGEGAGPAAEGGASDAAGGAADGAADAAGSPDAADAAADAATGAETATAAAAAGIGQAARADGTGSAAPAAARPAHEASAVPAGAAAPGPTTAAADPPAGGPAAPAGATSPSTAASGGASTVSAAAPIGATGSPGAAQADVASPVGAQSAASAGSSSRPAAASATPQCYTAPREEPANPPDTAPANPPAGTVQHETNEGEDEELPEADNCSQATGAGSAGPGAAVAPGAAAAAPAAASAGPAGVAAGESRPGPAAAAAGGGTPAADGTGGPAASPLEVAIQSAQAERDAAVSGYAGSRSALAVAGSGTSALRGGVGFTAKPGEEAAAAAGRRSAGARAERFFAGTADRLDAAMASAAGAVPDQLGVAAESGKAQIASALLSQKGAISGRIARGRGQARGHAARAAGAVRAQASAYSATVQTQTSIAVARLRSAHAAASAQVDQLETTTLDQINATYAEGRTELEGVGTTIGEECTAKGADYAAKYRNFKTCTENGFWDGDLSQRRAEAQAKAAEEMAAGYHERMVSGARTRAREISRDGRKADRCLVVNGASHCREALDSTLAGVVSAMEQSRDAALAQAAAARGQLLGSIRSALALTLAQLDAQETAERQRADDTAYLQQLLQEQVAHFSAASIQTVVASAVEQARGALASVQQACNGRQPPDPMLLDGALSQVEQRLAGALDGLDSSVQSGAVTTEGRLSDAADQGLAALEGVAQGSAEQVQALVGGFGRSMGQLAGRDNFATQRAAFTQQITESSAAATGVFTQVVGGMQKSCTDTLTGATGRLTQARTELQTNLQAQRQGLEGDMASKADEAASHEPPAWKQWIAWVLIIIVVIIVIAVVVASGGAALAPLGALMASLGPILTGAIVGAITSGLLYMATNLLNNEAITLGGLATAVAIGAVTGAIGGGLGARAGALVGASLRGASAAAQVGGQLAAALGLGVGLDVATQFVMGGFSFDHFSWQQLGITVAVTLLTFGIGHATARPRVPVPAPTASPEPTIGFGRTPRAPATPTPEPTIGFGRTPRAPATPTPEPTIGFGRTPRAPATPTPEPTIGFGRTPRTPATPTPEPTIGFGRTPGPRPVATGPETGPSVATELPPTRVIGRPAATGRSGPSAVDSLPPRASASTEVPPPGSTGEPIASPVPPTEGPQSVPRPVEEPGPVARPVEDAPRVTPSDPEPARPAAGEPEQQAGTPTTPRRSTWVHLSDGRIVELPAGEVPGTPARGDLVDIPGEGRGRVVGFDEDFPTATEVAEPPRPARGRPPPVTADRNPDLNWSNPDSEPTFGHSFNTHGEGPRVTRSLTGRAAGTGQPQGQWLDSDAAAAMMASRRQGLTEAVDIDIPPGLGQVIMPDGRIVAVTRARLVPSRSGGFKSSFPIL